VEMSRKRIPTFLQISVGWVGCCMLDSNHYFIMIVHTANLLNVRGLLLRRSLFTHGQRNSTSDYQELVIKKASLFTKIKPNLNYLNFVSLFLSRRARAFDAACARLRRRAIKRFGGRVPRQRSVRDLKKDRHRRKTQHSNPTFKQYPRPPRNIRKSQIFQKTFSILHRSHIVKLSLVESKALSAILC
jgi:hypothetical protein